MRADEHLKTAVEQAVANLSALLQTVDHEGLAIRPGLRSNLDLQLHTLREVEHDLLTGNGPNRRIWSLGQASIPVLNSLLNGVERAGAESAVAELVARCRLSVADMNDALTQFAEGR